MNISLPVSSTVQSVSFSVLTTEDIRRISVKQITNPVLLDDLNTPNLGGLYDPALGPVHKQDMYVDPPCLLVNVSQNFGQLHNLPTDILQLPRSFWPYRTASPGVPSAFHESYVQSAESYVSILSSFQVVKTGGEQHLPSTDWRLTRDLHQSWSSTWQSCDSSITECWVQHRLWIICT
jgi:hypothetical protein